MTSTKHHPEQRDGGGAALRGPTPAALRAAKAIAVALSPLDQILTDPALDQLARIIDDAGMADAVAALRGLLDCISETRGKNADDAVAAASAALATLIHP